MLRGENPARRGRRRARNVTAGDVRQIRIDLNWTYAVHCDRAVPVST